MFDLKNTNSLAENIIRHFDFSTIGFLDDEEESSSFLSSLNLAQTSQPNFEYDNIEDLHTTLELERDLFMMKLFAAREEFSSQVAETIGEGIDSQLGALDEIINTQGNSLDSKLDEVLASYELETVVISDIRSLGEDLLA